MAKAQSARSGSHSTRAWRPGRRLRIRLRRWWARTVQPAVRARRARRRHVSRDRGIERGGRWRADRSGNRVLRSAIYLGAIALVAWMGYAVYVVVRHDSHPGVDVEKTCSSAQFSCSAVAGVVGPVLSIALASAVFLAFRLRRVRRPYVRTAKKRPQDSVPTAGRILDKVVGRDELCEVIIADLRARATRRPHVIVGGVGAGKTAVLVQLTQLLAARGAVPVAVRLRDATTLNFRDLAKRRFLAEADRALLSDEEGARVWRHLVKDDRIVVLADGLEEALSEGNGRSDRDNLIRLALQRAGRERLPLVVASRPHNPLRGMNAAIIELEPLSEEAALDYVRSGAPSADERQLDWVVETADVSETPLYLQITRELYRNGLLDDVSRNPDDRSLDTRKMDRADLRLRLLQQWRRALERGDLLAYVPLTPEQRRATVTCLSALACLGLQRDSLEVRLDDFEALYERCRDGHPVPLVEELSRRLTGRDVLSKTLTGEVRLAATRGMDLDLVEARGEVVRFQHSILEAYLGADFIGTAMGDADYREAALSQPGRELLISLVLHSRVRARQAGRQSVASVRLPGLPGHSPNGQSLSRVLLEAAKGRSDVKALDLFAAALQVDAVDKDPEHQQIAEEIRQHWVGIEAGDPRTLEEAKLNLVHRYGEAIRTIADRRRTEGLVVCPAYLQLFELIRLEREYSVRLAAAQEIGAGGDEALAMLKGRLEPPGTAPENQQSSPTLVHPEEQAADSDSEADEGRHRDYVLRAWVVPLLFGSVRTRTDRDAVGRCLRSWLNYVRSAAALRDEAGNDLSLEVALAQGFKYAANRRRRHPYAREDARAQLEDWSGEMLCASEFWFTRLILIQALCLWRMPDPAVAEQPGQHPDFRAIVRRWGADRPNSTEHTFVAEVRRLAVWALESGRPERYLWIDESGIVSRIGSRPADPTAQRKHRLWISPSAGWTGLDRRAQQLVADVLLLLNLAERGSPRDRDRLLYRTRLPVLPPCLSSDRSPLDPTRSVSATYSQQGSNCVPSCGFGLCPYPYKGQQHYRHELSEAFCRRQQNLVARSRLRSHPAPWQGTVPGDLRLFWRQMGQPSPGPNSTLVDSRRKTSFGRRR
jgi:hypothetical protein